MDGEFEFGREFLKLTQEQSEFHPCKNRPSCGFPHRVVMHTPTRLVAVVEEDGAECLPFSVEPHDLLVYAVDKLKFCGAVARACKFESAPDSGGGLPDALNIWRVGTYAHTRSPVYFCLPDDFTLVNIEGLINSQKEPFILLAVSQRSKSAAVQSLLQRQRCEFIPLANSLALDGKGKFKITNTFQPVLDRFTAGLADVPSVKPVLEGIHRAISADHEERRKLREAKARLEQMHGEGLFGFVKKIDRATLDLFFVILAKGDIAKASRALELKDSTLRSRIAGWRKRGKPYLALAEFVRWRKSISGQAGIDFAKRMASGAERETDYPALIRDIVEELGEFNADNWDEKCDKLANLLRNVPS